MSQRSLERAMCQFGQRANLRQARLGGKDQGDTRHDGAPPLTAGRYSLFSFSDNFRTSAELDCRGKGVQTRSQVAIFQPNAGRPKLTHYAGNDRRETRRRTRQASGQVKRQGQRSSPRAGTSLFGDFRGRQPQDGGGECVTVGRREPGAAKRSG